MSRLGPIVEGSFVFEFAGENLGRFLSQMYKM